ncbi:unnamed protein product, partial [marine sediment metagenome]
MSLGQVGYVIDTSYHSAGQILLCGNDDDFFFNGIIEFGQAFGDGGEQK